MWHEGLPHQMEHDRWGRRCLFIDPLYWFQGFDADPAFDHFEPLGTLFAARLLHEVIAADRQALWRLYALACGSRLCDTPDEHETAHLLASRVLDADCIVAHLPPSRAGFCVLREDRSSPHVLPSPVPPTTTFKPAPLAARNAWIAIECVDQRATDRPVAGVPLELITASGEVRRERTNENGAVYVRGIAPGPVVIRVLELDGVRWSPLGGEPAQPSSEDARIVWHVVKQGECLSKVGQQYGLGSWSKIWEHPKNEALRAKRASPHVLSPGDQVAVPACALYEIRRSTDDTHRIALDTEAETNLRVRLLDMAREPLAGVEYELHYEVAGVATERPGRAPADADGWIDERVPLKADAIVVHLRRPAVSFEVALGHLDPMRDEDTEEPRAPGIAQRLSALGYVGEPAGGSSGDPSGQALATFQADELGPERQRGVPDAETLGALARIYGV